MIGTSAPAIFAAPAYAIENAHVPVVLAPALRQGRREDEIAPCRLVVEGGRIARLEPGGPDRTGSGDRPAYDARGGLVLPRFTDLHTHLDKGHIVDRAPNLDGTFESALAATVADRAANWSADDLRRRMDFALRCAFAHGTAAIRTHLDTYPGQMDVTWSVFAEMRKEWRGRIELQGVALFPYDVAADDEAQLRAIVTTVARHGGVLGGVTHLGAPPDARLDLALDRLVGAAAAHGLDLDLHVDESGSPAARSLPRVAAAVLRHRFHGRVLCGHCCSLALVPDEERAATITLLREAAVAVVSLPMVNLYLQDRQAGRTPRWRGVAPLHELDAAGVPVAVASDNTRDPFFAYGDLDMLEVFREAVRTLHLDHSGRPWAQLLGATAAGIMGLPGGGLLREGGPADLVLVTARNLAELVTRPQSDRVVLVAGRTVPTAPPDWRELD